jgi:hypothetical protein
VPPPGLHQETHQEPLRLLVDTIDRDRLLQRVNGRAEVAALPLNTGKADQQRHP